MSERLPDPSLTLEQDDAVRALLASARHTDPTPPEVAARLDATLASLQRERVVGASEDALEQGPADRSAPVVLLASRRRRTAATVLLAAAAVVVFGVGIGQVLPTTSGDDSGASSGEAATSAKDKSSPLDRSFATEEDSELADGESRSAQEAAPLPSSGLIAGGYALSSDSLKRQVRVLRRTADSAAAADSAACELSSAGAGTRVSVTFDGLPGAVIFRAPVGSTQQVDVFVCGQRGAVRSLEIRAR